MAKGTTPRDAGYRRCVGVMLFNGRGQVWVGQRADRAEPAWQMPQGGIDKGEAPERAARRELCEEIGLEGALLLAEAPGWYTYDFPPGVGRGRHRGQKQRWFAMLHRGDDAAFDLDAHSPPEFSAWRWVGLDEAVALVVAFKRPVYRAVAAAFADLPRRIREGAVNLPLTCRG
ncbi:MAG: RNA pyrophosphohydrolase [Alphaproteobacteria bacterium]